MMRQTAVMWDVDWGGQGAGADLGGGDQAVQMGFPRFVAELALRFDRASIGQWRAIRAQLRGRQNALRLRLIDPATMDNVRFAIHGDIAAWRSGHYTEPRPQVSCVSAVSAGAETLLVDETMALSPIQVGAHLSYADWPFMVVDRSGSGAATVLTVDLLRTAIPAGGQIDLIPRGLFLMDDPSQGAAAYGRQQRITPQLALSEWITRP